jgi:tRNA (guanine37-N1)-methyltransferase
MRFDLITIFPEFFVGPLEHGIVRRAREAGLIRLHVQDLREFTKDRHRTVDDRPFGGGEGMVLKPEPLFEAVESLLGRPVDPAANAPALDPKTAIVLTSAAGKLFAQSTARRYARLERIVFICGRYEGVDERVAQHLATEEVSIGDFVLSGGELAAALMVDAVTRLLPGALGNQASSQNESFTAPRSNERTSPVTLGAGARGRQPGDAEPDNVQGGYRQGQGASGNVADRILHDTNDTDELLHRDAPGPPESFNGSCLLDYPHYTRPAEFRGWSVPEVLIGGNHAEVAKWRRAAAIEKTRRMRPELLLHEPGRHN